MKKVLLLLLSVVVGILNVQAKLKTVTLEYTGTLSDSLSNVYREMDSLKIIGDINGSDILALREAIGSDVYASYKEYHTDNFVRYLDLSEANIVEGGNCYYYYYQPWEKQQYYPESNTISDYMFYRCYALKDIILPSNITKIGYSAFDGTQIQKIDIPNGVKIIDAFAFNKTKIKEINIPNSVDSIGLAAFCNCICLKSVTLPNTLKWLSQSVFASCTGLEEITIPKSVKAWDGVVFYNCTSLKSVYLQSETPASVNVSIFSEVPKKNLTIYVPIGSIDAYKQADVWKEYNLAEYSPASIEDIPFYGDSEVNAIYSIDGIKRNELRNGLNIVRYSNGVTKKVYKK